MTRTYIQAALFACRMGAKELACELTRRALSYANQEGYKVASGHLLAALAKGQRKKP